MATVAPGAVSVYPALPLYGATNPIVMVRCTPSTADQVLTISHSVTNDVIVVANDN